MLNAQPSVRRWEDVASILLGIVAAAAAVFLHPTLDAIVINGVIAGLAIVALAALEITVPPRWEEPFEMVAGIWLIASPFWLGYGDPLRIVHIVIGALVAILAAVELWQDRANIEASP
jgi:SPW repeat